MSDRDDLLKRLLDHGIGGEVTDGGPGITYPGLYGDMEAGREHLCTEAANEIARLRAVILRTHETHCTPPCVRCDYGNTGRCEPDCAICAGTGVDQRFARTGRHAPECLAFEVEP